MENLGVDTKIDIDFGQDDQILKGLQDIILADIGALPKEGIR